MAERTTSNTIIIIFTTIVVIAAVIVLIKQVEANLMFWTIRPSESTALDIVSKYTALGGTTGEVTTDYRNITSNINYNIYSSGKMVCVISRRVETGAAPLKTINCYSTPFAIIDDLITPAPPPDFEQEFHICFRKYDDFSGTLIVDSWWTGLVGVC